MSTVSWGKRTRYRFNAGGQLASFEAPNLPGVYAITYKREPQLRPKAHTVVHFGEADDLSKQLPLATQDVQRWWHDHSTDDAELFVFLRPMPGSSKFERDSVRSQLVSEYDPHGNE